MQKPAIIIGNGCRKNPALINELCSLGIPILTTWQFLEAIPEDSPVFCGRPGMIGERAANIIQQKATELFVFGAKLDNEQVGWNIKNFAPLAVKYVFDVDQAELNKLPDGERWIKKCVDLSIDGDVLKFIKKQDNSKWLAWCKDLYNRFRPELDGCEGGEFIDPYYFVSVLSDLLPDDAIIVPGSSGMQSCALMQAFKVKRGQRILLCNTIGSMGMEPMAIGAAIESDHPIVVVTGDGGFSLNMQELETVRREKLNIKYFVFRNGGYGSVVSMQDNRFGLRVGADEESGFTVPDYLGFAFELGFYTNEIKAGQDIHKIVKYVLELDKPALVEIQSSLEFKYACKVGSTLRDNKFILDPMEDMTPKISDLSELMAWDGKIEKK